MCNRLFSMLVNETRKSLRYRSLILCLYQLAPDAHILFHSHCSLHVISLPRCSIARGCQFTFYIWVQVGRYYDWWYCGDFFAHFICGHVSCMFCQVRFVFLIF